MRFFYTSMKTIKSSITLIFTVSAVIFTISVSNSLRGQHKQNQDNDFLTEWQVAPEGWISMFDGETLAGWEIVHYVDEEELPHVRNGVLVLPVAINGTMTGISWVGDSFPSNNYIIYYEARRVVGNDIFAALTFPYNNTFATLVFSGWRGSINGLSSIDGYDASENETTQFFGLRNAEWYEVQLRVTTDSIRANVGYEEVVDIATAGKKIHLRDEILNTGLTIWTYTSGGEIRNIRYKKLN